MVEKKIDKNRGRFPHIYTIFSIMLQRTFPNSVNQLNARVSGVLSVLDGDNVQLRYMRCFDVLGACVKCR